MIMFYILVVLAFGFVITNYILDNTAKEEMVNATITKKIIDTFIDSNNIINENYILVFKTLNGIKKFSVSYKVYQKYNELDSGKLIYKRNRFVNFILEKQ